MTQSSRPRILPPNSPKLAALKVDTSNWINSEQSDIMKWRSLTKLNDIWYHLLDELQLTNNLEIPIKETESALKFCKDCYKVLKKGELPKWSLTHVNLDYGIQPNLPTLTFAEQLAISLTILHGHVLKLNSGQFAHKGHFISFRHDSAFATSLQTCTLPRTDLSKTIIIVNIGPNRTATDMRRHASVKKRLEVRSENIYPWLLFLKSHNPLYRDIIINNDDTTIDNVNTITDNLVANAVQSNDETIVTAEKVGTASHITINTLQEPIQPIVDPNYDDISEVAITMEQVEQIMNTENTLDGQREISDVFITTRSEENAGGNNLPSTLEMVSATLNIPVEELRSAGPSVSAHHDNIPSNEFIVNDQIIMGAFPCLFPLGQGLGRLPNGPVSPISSRRLLLQYDGRFRRNPSLIFLLFNQLQRHSLCHSVAGRFKGNIAEEDMNNFIERVSAPDFAADLARASDNPNSKQAKELASYIERHLKPIASAVPWSDDERKSELSKLLSLVQHFGPPSFFCTINPCDMDSSAMLRMTSFGSSNPYKRKFQLPDQGLFENSLQRVAILADSPVESALAYSWIIEDIFNIIYELPSNNRTDLAHPEERQTTIFGKILAAFGVHEAQGRGSLHFHFLLWTDTLFDQVIRYDQFSDIHRLLQLKIDSIISSSIPQNFQSSQIIESQDMSKIRFNNALGVSGPTMINLGYDQFIRTLVEATQCHTHSVTCRKGKTGIRHCRMSFPQACVDFPTGFRQLTKKEDGKVVLQMRIDSPPIEPKTAQGILWFEDPRKLVLECIRPSEALKKSNDVNIYFPARHNTKETGRLFEDTTELSSQIFSQSQREGLTMTQPIENPSIIERALNCLKYFDPRSDRNIIGSNSNVVPYNQTMLALLRCNTAMLPIGGCQQARVVIFYVAKYITKPAVSPTTILPLLKLSYKDVMETFPSVADDTGTTERTAKHLLTRIINKRFALCEYSAQQHLLPFLTYLRLFRRIVFGMCTLIH